MVPQFQVAPVTTILREELPGLPCAVYPEETENPWTTEPPLQTVIGSSPGKPDLVQFGCQSRGQGILAGSPVDPVAEHSATVRAQWSRMGPGPPMAPQHQPHPRDGDVYTPRPEGLCLA